MIRITGLLLLALLAACSLPLGDGSSLAAGSSGRPAGTASLNVSTPYGGGRAMIPLQTIQTTVEPENLGQLFDHVTVVLDSLAQPNVTKTVPVGQASLIRIDGLYEASDWTMTVTAYDGTNAPVAAASFNQGGISTLKGQVTSVGDVFLNPIAGPGTGSFELNLLDLPPEVYPENTSWTLEPLNADGSLGSAMDAGDLTKVSTSGTGHQLTVKTLTGQTIPTGSYRLTMTLRTLSGQALSWTPVYVVNVYPGLTSTKTVPGTTWPNPLPAPSITFPIPTATSNTGLVVTWQPSDPTPVTGYEYFWIPNTSPLPDVTTFDPTFFVRADTRSGFIPANATSRFRPSWILPAADIPAAQQVSSDWGFYVRSVTTTGTKGPWAASTVAVDVSFNVVLRSVTLAGALADRYELRRLGPSGEAHLTVPPSGLINPEIASLVPLSRFAFTLGDPSSVTAKLNLPEQWILAPGQQLVLANSTSTVPVRIWIDRTKPNQPAFDLYLYPQTVSTYDSVNDNTVDETYCVAVSAPLPTLAGPGSEWTFRLPSNTVVESRITASAVGPITDPIVPPSTLNYQIVPLTYLSGTNTFQPAFDKASTIAPDTWAAMLWTAGSEAVAARNVVARPVWNLGANGTLFGAWSPVGWSPGVSAAPVNVLVNVTTNVLSWDAVDTSGWGTAQVTGYSVDKVGGYPGLPLTLAPEVHQLIVSSYGVGDYTVTTLFQRADGRAGASAPTAWPLLVTLPGSVMADDAGRVPTNVSHKPENARGRYLDLEAERGGTGWLASGYSGPGAELFLSRHDSSARLNTVFGDYNGTTFFGAGTYFGDSLGFVQDPLSPYAIVMNGVYQNGAGNNLFRQYSFQGVNEPGYNDNAGTRIFAAGGPFDRVPLGRLVLEPSSNQVFSLMWDGGTNDGGLSNYGLTRVNFDGTVPAENWLNTDYLHRLAVKNTTTLLAIGNGGLINRISTSSLALDTTVDGTIWTGDGIATVTVNSATPDWKDILVMNDGRILLTGWAGTTGYVVRLQSTGALDTSFSGTGWVALPGLYPQDLAVGGSNEVAVTGDNFTTETDGGVTFLKVFSASGTPSSWLDKTLAGTTVHGASARAVAYNGSRLMVAGFVRLSSNLQDTLPALWSF